METQLDFPALIEATGLIYSRYFNFLIIPLSQASCLLDGGGLRQAQPDLRHFDGARQHALIRKAVPIQLSGH